MTQQPLLPQVFPEGPTSASIMIIGEAPGATEVETGRPFMGASGQELTRMLDEAGIDRDSCFITNVARRRPPHNDIENFYEKNTAQNRIPGPILKAGMALLYEEIRRVSPKIIIALGDTALWTLTNERGITKWRGSSIQYSDGEVQAVVLPTYHPAAILRQWSWRAISVLDLKRAAKYRTQTPRVPAWGFHIRPSFKQTLRYLSGILSLCDSKETWIGGDLETRNGHIACFGITADPKYLDCISIPFMCVERPDGYWSLNEEAEIVSLISHLFRHPNARWVFQNGLYDYQYFVRHWRVVPRLGMDTMLAHHTLWAGLPKGLDFLSSMYCGYHRYWKDEGKEWTAQVNEDQLWEYNCKDCVSMMEVKDNLLSSAEQLNLSPAVSFQHRQFHAVLDMMVRGVRTNAEQREVLSQELQAYKDSINSWFETVLEKPLNVGSNKQMQQLFYGEIGMKPVLRKRKGGKYTPSCDDDALELLGKRQPLLRPLLENIARLRSIGVFKSTFIDMNLDDDGRLRTSYNIAGTETFRWSSSENAFGSGGNLQNIPKGDKDSATEQFPLPNVRKLFIPDSGYTIAEWDLDRADVQVVAWESNDDALKQMLREGVNLHSENAKDIFGRYPTDDNDPIYKQAKVGVHATNYGVSPPTLSRSLGITRAEAEHFIRRWFQVHPGIADWHDRVMDSLQQSRSVRNKFGYRRHYFDRIEGILPEALAWIPQSTVALVIDKGIVNIFENLPEVNNLLQVHDSVVNQFPTERKETLIPLIQQELLITVPYDDPLVIPVGVNLSEVSWGDAKEYPL